VQAYQVAWSSQMMDQADQMLQMHARRKQRPEKSALGWELERPFNATSNAILTRFNAILTPF